MFLVAMCWSQLHLNKGPLRYLKAVRIPGSESPADCLAFEFFLHTYRNTTWEIQILESMWMDDSVFVSWVFFTFLTSENLAHVSIMQSVYIDFVNIWLSHLSHLSICRFMLEPKPTRRCLGNCWSSQQSKVVLMLTNTVLWSMAVRTGNCSISDDWVVAEIKILLKCASNP